MNVWTLFSVQVCCQCFHHYHFFHHTLSSRSLVIITTGWWFLLVRKPSNQISNMQIAVFERETHLLCQSVAFGQLGQILRMKQQVISHRKLLRIKKPTKNHTTTQKNLCHRGIDPYSDIPSIHTAALPRTTTWTYVDARGTLLYLDRSAGTCFFHRSTILPQHHDNSATDCKTQADILSGLLGQDCMINLWIETFFTYNTRRMCITFSDSKQYLQD